MRLITGMHRSGTSLIARLFFEAGAHMGDPARFYRPDRWNPDGYFEQTDIHAINMPLINGPWWKLANLRLPSTQTILRRAERQAGQIEQTAAQYRGKVVKEVRFALTMPAWQKYGTQFDAILVPLREPVAAARSIQKRYRIPMGHAYYLWVEYFSRLLDHMGDLPNWYVRYRRVVDAGTFHEELGAAYRFMGFEFSPAKLDDLYRRCVRPDLDHYREEPPPYPPAVEKLWHELRCRHARQFDLPMP